VAWPTDSIEKLPATRRTELSTELGTQSGTLLGTELSIQLGTVLGTELSTQYDKQYTITDWQGMLTGRESNDLAATQFSLTFNAVTV